MLLYNSQSDQKNYYLSKPILKQDFTQACASDRHLTHSWRSFVRFDFAIFVYVLLLPPVPVDADSTDTAALTFSHDRNHLLAFLNTLLKFQRCQMPTPISFISICQSLVRTLPWPPVDRPLHWPRHLTQTPLKAPRPIFTRGIKAKCNTRALHLDFGWITDRWSFWTWNTSTQPQDAN